MLEDTGYMARVAFVMDKLLRKIGLSGRSIVPMLIGFGCTVPAVMATRTLPSERDRKHDHLAHAVHELLGQDPHLRAVLTAAFFPEHGALVMVRPVLLAASLSASLAALVSAQDRVLAATPSRL